MFTLDLFGGNSITDTPYPVVSINGTSIEVFFSPETRGSAPIPEAVREKLAKHMVEDA